MKYVYMQKGKLFVFLCIGLLMLAMTAMYIGGVLKNASNTGVFTAMNGEDLYEVRNRVLLEAVQFTGVCEPKKAAEVWAEGLKRRNAGMQYIVMCESLKKEYAKALEKNAPYWVTGVSSPWIKSYTIEEITPVDEEQFRVRVSFMLAASSGAAGKYKAVLKIVHEKDLFCIEKIDADEGLKPYTGM